jgi:serine protease Do
MEIKMNSIALSKRKDFAAYRATWVFAAALCLLILQALQATAQMLPNTFADLADEISPSVVNITTTTVIAWSRRSNAAWYCAQGLAF